MIQDILCSNPPREPKRDIQLVPLLWFVDVFIFVYRILYTISSYVISFMVKQVHL